MAEGALAPRTWASRRPAGQRVVLASKTSDYSEQPLLLNFGGVLVSVLAKLPEMHGVRVFGINKDP